MENRKPGGVPMQRAFLESHRLAGKLWLTEMDQFPLGVEKRSGGTAENFSVNCADLRRNALQPIMGGHGFWYYDHRLVPTLEILQELGDVTSSISSIYRKRGWWDSPEMMAEIGKIQRAAEKFIERPYTSDADVLIIYDSGAKYYHKVINADTVEYKLFEGIARCGAAYDCIYLSDLEDCDTSKYRCVIFADCPNITESMRRVIRKKTSGAVCVYLHGSGFSDGKTLSLDAISKSVGMRVEETVVESVILDDGSALALDDNISPVFRIADGDAEVILRFDNGEAAVARRGNNVFASLHYLPKESMKRIFDIAGVHLFCDSGEPVIAASGCVMLNCQRAGERRLKLRDGDSISIKTDGYETVLVDTKTKQRLL